MNEEIATGQDQAMRDNAISEQPIDGAQGGPAENGGSGGAVSATSPLRQHWRR